MNNTLKDDDLELLLQYETFLRQRIIKLSIEKDITEHALSLQLGKVLILEQLQIKSHCLL